MLVTSPTRDSGGARYCNQFVHNVQGGPKKTGPFLRVYNFATVGARNACDMSKFSKFYLEKNVKLACQCF